MITLARTAAQDAERDRIALFREMGKIDFPPVTFADDLEAVRTVASIPLDRVSSVPGSADPQMEVMSGVAELQVNVIRPALARYGLNVSDVQELIQTRWAGNPCRR